jgi:pyruvate/2-oxoglutarate dehydrogenase complex dihydrolipoamide dehydrogenase (E3) component
MTDAWNFPVEPMDDNNLKLMENVRPLNWENPEPLSKYNLVVIGAGTGGLITAAGAAGLGAKVALVERHLMGGDCLNAGCVPSKALIRPSRLAAEMRNADEFGLSPVSVDLGDFTSIMARLRRLRTKISQNDSAKRYRDELGVDVFIGEAKFSGPDMVQVGNKKLRFSKAVIASGARAFRPDIPGLEEAGFLTNETVFNLTELPPRLAVIGGGPIGCELAQAFRRLGSEVTIIQQSRFLPREDSEASALLAEVFDREGIHVMLEASPIRIEKTGSIKKLIIKTNSGEHTVEAEEILIGAGRRPNIEGLELEKANVAYDPRSGVKVDDFLRTTNPLIFAVGDICMNWKFTHAADAAARIAIQNALFRGRKKLSALNMPWCTYTSPEIAHVGLYEADARAAGIAVDTYKVDMADVDRAVLDGETDGFVKILVRKGTDKIIGATIVAAHAGDIISEISVAMSAGIGLKKIADVIHPYPTQAEAIRRAAFAYNKTRLTPRIASFLKGWLNWQRR